MYIYLFLIFFIQSDWDLDNFSMVIDAKEFFNDTFYGIEREKEK